MASKGRIPPPHLTRPLPGPGIGHPDPFAPGRPPHGGFPPFDMLPPPEVMEQKLSEQHAEIKKLAIENQRLAATHGNLRQDLAAIQHDKHMMQNHVGTAKSEKEQQIMGLIDRIRRMEADLQGAEPLRAELQQARAEAQSLHSAREELVSRVHQLTEEHQRAQRELQQLPALMSELESLRQEYQHCRATFDYEKKLYNEHLESLQVMEKNYMTMATEVEKLRAELTRYADLDRKAGGPYGGYSAYNEKEATGLYSAAQNAYEDAYGVPQGRGPLPGGGSVSGSGIVATTVLADGDAQSGPPTQKPGSDAQKGPVTSGFDAQKGPVGPGYDAQRGPNGPGYDTQKGSGGAQYDSQRGPAGPSYDMHRGPVAPAYGGQRGYGYDHYGGPAGAGYDAYKGPAYDAQRGHGYEMQQRGPGYDSQRGVYSDVQKGPGYDAQRMPGYEARGPGFDGHRAVGGAANFDSPQGTGYDAQPRSGVVPQGQVPAQVSNMPYGSTTPPVRAGSGFQAPPPGANPGRR